MLPENFRNRPRNGHLLRTCRHVLSLSHDKLAQMLGVASKRTIRRWETNRENIPDYVWDTVSHELGAIKRMDLIQRILERQK